MKFAAIFVLAAVAMAGCTQKAESTSSAGAGGQIKVDKLFTHDGCTVYRFQDVYQRYFVRCDVGQGETMTSQSCGKACTSHTQIPTSACRQGAC